MPDVSRFTELEVQIPGAEVLLIVPPFAHLSWPALGVHVLQAVAREQGFETRIVYANLVYAAMIGRLRYAQLCNTPGEWLLGERVFRRAAFGLAPIGETPFLEHPLQEGADPTRYLDQLSDATGEIWVGSGLRFSKADLLACSSAAVELCDGLAEALAASGARVVGATTMFEQTAASLALLRRIKKRNPAVTTILGGANCEGPMAEGLLSLAEGVDHLFSGESEASFARFLAEGAESRVVQGSPCQDLDALPPVSFDDYFHTIATTLPSVLDDPVWLSYETSRGCWWGAKQHCTFCGLNGLGMGFREKSPDRVISELSALLSRHPTHRVAMTDNIMPFRYHKSLIPRLPTELPGAHLFYEQKANLGLRQVKALYDGGNAVIQPGIESLSSPVLKRMRKGVLARQNLSLLRYARSVGMGVKWNLLYGFPGDDAVDYERMAEFLPRLVHLAPPNALTHLSIDRFSPYFDEPGAFGIRELRPLPAYAEVFPGHASVEQIAYHFQGEWQSGSLDRPELLAQLFRQIVSWRQAWDPADGAQPPALFVRELSPERFVLYDTRGLGGGSTFHLNRAQARAVLVGGPSDRVELGEWAVRSRFAIWADGWCVPLATSRFETLDALEQEDPEVATAAGILQVVSA